MKLKNKLLKIASCFILDKKKRKIFRENFLSLPQYEINGINNQIIIFENGSQIDINKGAIKGLKIFINGNNNFIKIDLPTPFEGNNINIEINADNASIDIQKSHEIRSLQVLVGCGNNQKLSIGKDCSIGGIICHLYENNAAIEIGERCLFSGEIMIYSSDGHTILDKDTKNIINKPTKPVVIGNHVWVGRKTVFTKNATVPDNSIIGIGSVVTKSFDEENVVIAGNPAKIIKKHIDWDLQTISAFEEN